jgi:TolA-binding protein
MKFKLSNIIHWLLLASLFTFFTACGSMSSVRNGKYTIAKSEKIEEIKNVPTDSLLLSLYDANAEPISESQEKPPVAETKEVPVKHIPTLQEQLNSLASRQDNLDNRLDNIESQTGKINQRLDEIAELIKDSKINTQPVTTGISNESSDKPSSEAFVLYPDEKVSQKKKPKVKKKVTPVIEESKIKEPQYYKEAVNFVESKDYNRALLLLLKEEQKQSDPQKLSECRYLIAKSFLALNRYSQAADYFNRVLKSNISYEKKAEAQASIGKIQVKLGNKEAAKKAYKEVLDKYATTLYVVEAKKMLQKL